MKMKHKQRNNELIKMLSKYRNLLKLPASSKICHNNTQCTQLSSENHHQSVNAISQEEPHTTQVTQTLIY
jgi:hypothetical protein